MITLHLINLSSQDVTISTPYDGGFTISASENPARIVYETNGVGFDTENLPLTNECSGRERFIVDEQVYNTLSSSYAEGASEQTMDLIPVTLFRDYDYTRA